MSRFLESIQIEIDDAGGGITYIGKSESGVATSEALWQIQRVTETGLDAVFEWADGNDAFDNVWDDRAVLSYS